MILNNYSICGNTPLIKISKHVYGKLETYNPTGSVKDRMVHYIIREAIEKKEIREYSILCEATSGNTGISLSSIAASLNLPCIIFMPSNMSEERKQMMRIYGAEIIESEPDDFEKAISMRDEYLSKNKNAWSPMQFSNLNNVKCHREITGPEIYHQVKNELGLEWNAFIHGSGTGGTIEGIRQYLSKLYLDTKVCMTIPYESPHGIQGIGDGRDFLANPDDMHDIFKIKTSDAIQMSKDFTKKTGLLVGISSGANILAANEYLTKYDVKGAVVTMLCDRGERYMSIY
jgi:cysteine synthase A